MKLESFKFQDGKVFWLPNYPSKELSLYQFLELEAKSLASAIEVAPEDAGKVKKIIFMQNPEVRTARSIFHPGQLEDGKVYSAKCEIIATQNCIHIMWSPARELA